LLIKSQDKQSNFDVGYKQLLNNHDYKIIKVKMQREKTKNNSRASFYRVWSLFSPFFSILSRLINNQNAKGKHMSWSLNQKQKQYVCRVECSVVDSYHG